jgi:uncharacterized protein (TIGR03435 family)
MRRALIGLFVLLAASASTFAQVSFEVASVKPHAPNADEPFGGIEILPGGRLIATGLPLRELVRFAYGLQAFQIDGGEEWISSTRFDVSAKASDGATGARQMRLMLRSLLQERFKLRVRSETRTLAVYELLKTSRDGRLGPQLKPSAIDCSSVLDGREIFDMSPVDGNAECRPGGKSVFGPGGATIVLVRKGMTMPLLARLLSSSAGRTVIDRTGLAGTYDLELSYSPPVAFYATREQGIKVANDQGGGTPIFTAVREQLGLTLESARGPSEVLIIESAARPEPD